MKDDPISHARFDELQSIEQLESAPITGVHLWWEDRWLDKPHAILMNGLCQWIFVPEFGTSLASPTTEEEQAIDPVAPQITSKLFYCQVVISGSRDLPKGDTSSVIEAVVNEIHQLFPKARQSKLVHARVITDPRAVFSVVPDSHRSRPTSNAWVKHRLILAGDWTATGWPATMEGAIRSGNRAAADILLNAGALKAIDWPADSLQRGRVARWMIRS